MSLNKKYAGLPDLDPAPEIYETPELTDDVSTLPTGTVRTPSPTPSEESKHDPHVGLDRQRIDRDEARRRFEPALVDARDVDFSDSLAGNRKSYRTSHRRRVRRDNARGDDGEFSDVEEETLAGRLARLRREAEELRLALEQGEGRSSKNGVEEQDPSVEDGVAELSRILNGLQTTSRVQGSRSTEAKFTGQLGLIGGGALQNPRPDQPQRQSQAASTSETLPTSIAAIADFADRLEMLETALGLSSLSQTSGSLPLLPTLAGLSSRIDSLSSTLHPPRDQKPTTSSLSSTSPSHASFPTIDALKSRIDGLTAASEKLVRARKAAQEALNELHEARLRQANNSAYSHHRPLSSSYDPAQLASSQEQQREHKVTSELFLDEQANKINALYQTLPTIQNLNPLLPVVLERLRTLSVVHAGAAGAREEINEIEQRQGETQQEIAKWKEGIEGMEKRIGEMEAVLRQNVEVMGTMVEKVEKRVQALER